MLVEAKGLREHVADCLDLTRGQNETFDNYTSTSKDFGFFAIQLAHNIA